MTRPIHHHVQKYAAQAAPTDSRPKRPTIPRAELEARIVAAIDADDRFALRSIEDETTDKTIKRVLRNADNLLIAARNGDEALEHQCAVGLTSTLKEVKP